MFWKSKEDRVLDDMARAGNSYLKKNPRGRDTDDGFEDAARSASKGQASTSVSNMEFVRARAAAKRR